MNQPQDRVPLLVNHEHASDVVLCATCCGQWIVETQSGTTYLLDLDEATATRYPDRARVEEWLRAGSQLPSRDQVVGWTDRQGPGLRADGEPLRLLDLHPVRVGASMGLVLQVLDPSRGPTLRPTTPVAKVASFDDAVRCLTEQS